MRRPGQASYLRFGPDPPAWRHEARKGDGGPGPKAARPLTAGPTNAGATPVAPPAPIGSVARFLAAASCKSGIAGLKAGLRGFSDRKTLAALCREIAFGVPGDVEKRRRRTTRD